MSAIFHIVNLKNKIVSLVCRSFTQSSMSITSVKFYTGTKPVSVETAATGTLLATVTLATANWTAANGGVAALAQDVPFTGTAAGTAGYARCANTAGAVDLIDLDVGAVGSGADMELTSTVISTSTNANTIKSFSIKAPDTAGAAKYNVDFRNRLCAWLTGENSSVINFSGGTLDIYSGSAPTSADAAPTGTKLVSFSLLSYNAPAGGTATLAGNVTATALATGTAGYARFSTSTFAMIGSAGLSGTNAIIDTLSITSGATITLSEASFIF